MSRLQALAFSFLYLLGLRPRLLHFAPLALSLVARELASAPLRAVLA